MFFIGCTHRDFPPSPITWLKLSVNRRSTELLVTMAKERSYSMVLGCYWGLVTGLLQEANQSCPDANLPGEEGQGGCTAGKDLPFADPEL